MAFTYGFYNSIDHDRRYDAVQMSQIFDGIIRDGVYASVGKCFIVREGGYDNSVVVQPGRAWFDHTWNYNDADMLLEGEPSEILLDRIDAIVLDINADISKRENEIIWIKGIPASSPQKPILENQDYHHQYPLCYIRRQAGVSRIRQADITNTVGTNECPFVTGILEVISIDELLPQWRDQLDKFVEDEEKDFEEWETNIKAEVLAFKKDYEEWTEKEKRSLADHFRDLKDEGDASLLTLITQLVNFRDTKEHDFLDWFKDIQGIFSADPGGELILRVEKLTDRIGELEQMFYNREILTSINTSDDKYYITDDFGVALLAESPICECTI